MLNSTKKSGRTIFSLVITVALMCLMTAAIIPGVMGTATFVDLTDASHYAIMSGSGITNTGSHSNVIIGDIGDTGTSSQMDGVFCSEMNGGTIYGFDVAYTGDGTQACFVGQPPDNGVSTAFGIVQTAFTDANGQAVGVTLTPESLQGLTLAPDVYFTSSKLSLPADGWIVLDAGGNPDAVWVFQIKGDAAAGGLTTGANSRVILSNGAQAKNVFWVVTGPTSLGANSVFNGNIISGPATTTIALVTGAKVNGRLLTGKDVNLDANIVTLPTDASVHGGPLVTSVSPLSGPLAGLNTVTITGTGFTGATGVTFGGESATIVGTTTDTTITATLPAHADVIETVDVVVTTPVGTGTGTALYTYADPPTVQSAQTNAAGDLIIVTFDKPMNNPSGNSGDFKYQIGGIGPDHAFSAAALNATTSIIDLTITGSVIASGDAVTVSYTKPGVGAVTATDAGILATFTNQEVVNKMPAPPEFVSAATNAAGDRIILTFDKPMAATSDAAHFTYKINVAGPYTFGTAVLNATDNHVIDLTALSTSIASGNTVTVSYTPGTVKAADTGVLAALTDKSVVNGMSALAPTITSISPSSGLTAGGTIVTITGTGLATTTGVTFDGLAVAYTVVSGTSITVTTTAHSSGSVNIVVTTPLGTATGSGTTGYTFGSATAVNLGTADNFVILSKTGITDVPTSDIRGNIGTSPITGASITGLGCTEVTGTIYTVDATGPACRVIDPVLLGTAVSDMETAYNDVAGRTPTDYLNAGTGGDLAGLTLAPGVYTFNGVGNVVITNDVTLSGNANDVWIFQIPGTLDISSGKQVILSGGAQKQNIFWQVAGVTTLGTTSVFEGTILSKTKIALQTGATLNGKALAQTEVTLQSNKINVPAQAPAPAAPQAGINTAGDSSYGIASSVSAESGQLAPVLPSLVTSVFGAGPLAGNSFVADITDMPGVAVSWATVINEAPATNAKVTSAILPNVDQSTLNALSTALIRGGLDIRDLAYGMAIQQTGSSSLSPTTVSMSVSQSWVTLNGGKDNIRIIGVSGDGTTEVMNTWYEGSDPSSGYLIFKATSLQGGLGTSYWLVSVKPYTPPAIVSIAPVIVPTSSTVAPVSSTVPGTGQMAPTQVPATTTTTSTGIPLILVGGILAALVLIGVGVITYTRRNK